MAGWPRFAFISRYFHEAFSPVAGIHEICRILRLRTLNSTINKEAGVAYGGSGFFRKNGYTG